MLLWPALAIQVAASLSYYATSESFPLVADMVSHALGYALLAMLCLGLGAGNRWARAFFLIFLAWNLVLTGPKLYLESLQSLPWRLALDIAILLIQVWAAFLLFRPSSNDWFRGVGSAATPPAPTSSEG